MFKKQDSKNKYVDYPEIGSILFRKSNKAKSVIISIKSPDDIRVAVPKYITFRRAESFVNQRLDWINKHLTNLQKKTNAFDNVSDKEKSNLIERTKTLSHKYGYNFNKITVKKMRSRWGSCSQDNNISLNIGLITITSELRDYVILHELVHTKIKNHSVEFWKELNRIIPDARKLNRQLNQNYGLFIV